MVPVRFPRQPYARWKVLLALAAFVALLAGWMGFSENGFIRLYQAEREKRASQAQIQELRRERQELENELSQLRTDLAYIEALARKELNLVQPNELVVRYAPPQAAEPWPAPKAGQAP